MAQDEPGMTQSLLAAAACYEAEHELVWETWRLVGYEADSPQLWHNWVFDWEDRDLLDTRAHTLADPEIRRRIVPLIHQAQAQDAAAIGHIRRALEGQASTQT
jgi:hypothetical protein